MVKKEQFYTAEELAKILAPYLKISTATLVEKLSRKDSVITLKKDIDRPTAQAIRKLGLREISLGKKNTRIYPQGSMASHILGYYNFDADIASGVELTAKDQLEHVEKNVQTERTPDGNIIYSFSTDPVATTTATTTSTTTNETSSSTPSIIDTIKNAVSDFVDKITGTSSKDEVASTSTATTTEESTTTPEVSATPTPPEETGTSTNLIDKMKDAVVDAFQNVTGTSTDQPKEEPKPADPLPAPTPDAPVTPPTN